ncbi:NUDIX hydrolase [Gilvimarinus sp. F26214L]|uniref:NUDIX hydrolase n=1 Tax=Gilvimarinus sp. DZF01 TaxID=3461371 RepID=UPI004045691A
MLSYPSPSSTVMLLRDHDEDGLQALLVRRNHTLTTGGGAWVFPGGRVDPADYIDPDDHFLAAQNAALRETREETNLRIERSDLIPFAHWTTPEGSARRFATWFFLAHLRGSAQVQVDGEEIVDHRWLSPSAALAAQRAGEVTLMPPTFVSLSLAAQFGDCGSAVADFRCREVQFFSPRICETDEGRIILYDDDAGYKGSNPNEPGPRHRVYIEGNNWRYEDSRTP